ncbi:TonB-dependent receptor domain-containing protein [Mucilaginibacter sp.]|uniref:TonB-dependent receptor n=1 Tax=Mucilaginibacter sp. TaxID=1882438 RepID=UPI002845DEDF|nr:TonB-dependent receptor [Mucilaginibacter sp.]MDR3695224.1 TonB-dependent receptor [Mucilaginibacter sp.]
MKKLLLLILSFFIYSCLIAQQKNIIRGKVIDSLTQEPIESAIIKVMNSGSTVVTDSKGNFIFRAIKGDSLLVSYIGYRSRIIKQIPDKTLLIALAKGAITLKDVTITNNETINTYRTLSNLDLNMQPAKSAQDLLRLVPGLFIAQHQGGGKAEQIFLRGFDADHGTDVNISVDGIPVNMVSQAHGQGYADLHFLIPETVSGYDFGKGPYYTDKGDFNTAGYVAYHTKDVLDQDMVRVEAGQFSTFRTVALINLLSEKAKEKGTNAYIAADGLFSNGGPFIVPEHFTRYNVFGKFVTRIDSNNKLTAILSTLKSDWRASGETPDRAVAEGYITNRFGTLDSVQGGHTARTNASLKLTTNLGDNLTIENQLWYSHYYFNLVSNFSFYYYFPATGDEFRQYEIRDLGGYNGKISKTTTVNNTSFTTTAGIGTRYDHIDPSELDHTENGQFLGYLQYGRTEELNANSYIDETILTGNWLFNAGVRVDYFDFNYQNLAADTIATNIFNGVSANQQKATISPKLSAEYTFDHDLQLYFKAGKGFHSNDARVVIANRGYAILPAAYGADLGVNWKPLPGLYINTAAWYLFLQQEFTFGSDLIDQPAGPVGPSGRTVRIGVDFSARYQLTDWLFTNLNVNVARPRYIDSAKGHDYVELAPTLTSTAGLNFRLKNGINGGISYRYLHDRAANTGYSLTARGYFITDLTVNYTQKSYEIGIAIENLFNRRWDEAQFEYTSQLKGETAPVDQVSYTPGVPFFAKLRLAVFF